MGLTAAPAMRRGGYDTELSAGSTAAGGTPGIPIPPSMMLIVTAIVFRMSVVRLFADRGVRARQASIPNLEARVVLDEILLDLVQPAETLVHDERLSSRKDFSVTFIVGQPDPAGATTQNSFTAKRSTFSTQGEQVHIPICMSTPFGESNTPKVSEGMSSPTTSAGSMSWQGSRPEPCRPPTSTRTTFLFDTISHLSRFSLQLDFNTQALPKRSATTPFIRSVFHH